MSFSFNDFAEALKNGAEISSEDVLEARRWAWSDGVVSPAEAQGIFELNGLAKDRSPEWVDFFVEALNDYVVNHMPPKGYVDEGTATWLMEQIDRDGRVDTLAELELLVKIMETALNVPDSLKAYALKQIEAVVVTGEGPTRRAGELRPGSVDAAEVALLRRLLFAGAGSGATIVSRDEAELVWRLKHATTNGANAPEWKVFFVQAIGNHLMAHNFYHALDRSEAKRLDDFVSDTHHSTAGFLSRMAGSVLHPPVKEAFAAPKHDDIEGAVAADKAITSEEATWLRRHIDEDGQVDDIEQALLDFIAEETGSRI